MSCVMVKRSVQKRSSDVRDVSNSQSKLLHETQTSILSIVEAVPMSFDSKLGPVPANNGVQDVSEARTTDVKTVLSAELQTQAIIKIKSPIIDSKYTFPSTEGENQTGFTFRYNSNRNDLSVNQSWAKAVMEGMVNVKQEKVIDTTITSFTAIHHPKDQQTDFYDHQVGSLYKTLSHEIIDEVLRHVEISTKEKPYILDHGYTVGQVARLVEAFIMRDRANLMLIEKEPTKPAMRDNDIQIRTQGQDFWCARLAANREKTAKLLSLTGADFYSGIVPNNIIDRLKTNPQQCAANKTTGKRCTKWRPEGRGSTRRLMRELADLPKPLKFSKVIELLAGVIGSAFCHHYHQKKPRSRLQDLSGRFCKIVGEDQNLELISFQRWIHQLIKSVTPDQTVDVQEELSCRSEHGGHEVDGNFTSNMEPGLEDTRDRHALPFFDDTSADLEIDGRIIATFPGPRELIVRHFKLYTGWNKKQRNLSPESLVEVIAKTKLPKTHITSKGRIYIYWHSGNFLWVKIGSTKESTTDRVAQWKAQCGYDATEHTDNTQSKALVPHPQRVERLIQAELKMERHEIIECQGCGGSHTEWFNVASQKAHAVVNKWTDWMRECDPYDQDGNFKTDSQIKLPTVGEEVAKSVPKSSQRRKNLSTSQRHSLRRSTRIAAQEDAKRKITL